MIPGYLPESVTIPETHRPAVISWLRTLRGRVNSVRLTWEKPGHLTLTHRDYDTVGAPLQVTVTIDGADCFAGVVHSVFGVRISGKL